MSIFDDHPISFSCPKCEASVETTIGEARQSPTVTCPNGHEIKIEGSSLDEATGEVQKSLDDLSTTIEKINRGNP